jgi:hypothetical protein
MQKQDSANRNKYEYPFCTIAVRFCINAVKADLAHLLYCSFRQNLHRSNSV